MSAIVLHAMNKPTVEDMELAASWLDFNTGCDGESEQCARVATWLREQAFKQATLSAARKGKVPVKMLRERLKRTETQ